jgi:hypothetical protein
LIDNRNDQSRNPSIFDYVFRLEVNEKGGFQNDILYRLYLLSFKHSNQFADQYRLFMPMVVVRAPPTQFYSNPGLGSSGKQTVDFQVRYLGNMIF